jgi:hypothetical protein
LLFLFFQVEVSPTELYKPLGVHEWPLFDVVRSLSLFPLPFSFLNFLLSADPPYLLSEQGGRQVGRRLQPIRQVPRRAGAVGEAMKREQKIEGSIFLFFFFCSS